MLSFSECLLYVCAVCLLILFLSALSVFHGKNLILLNLINRYVTSASLFKSLKAAVSI